MMSAFFRVVYCGRFNVLIVSVVMPANPLGLLDFLLFFQCSK